MILHTWACNSDQGGATFVQLEPGTYYLHFAPVVLAGALKGVARVTRTKQAPISGPDGFPLEQADEVDLEPVESADRFTVEAQGEYRLSWNGRGSAVLYIDLVLATALAK
jgi:hypothetical protein